MFLSVLTKNLNWESLTENLVNFNFIMGVYWKIWFFLRGDGLHKLKVGAGWFGGGGQFSELRGKGFFKKEGVFSLPHCGRQGACHDITKSADSQTNINFSENDCTIAEILQKCLSNKWLQTEDLRKQGSIWKNSNWVKTDAGGQSTF